MESMTLFLLSVYSTGIFAENKYSLYDCMSSTKTGSRDTFDSIKSTSTSLSAKIDIVRFLCAMETKPVYLR